MEGEKKGEKKYNFTRFDTPDLIKAKICLLLAYLRDGRFSGIVNFAVKKNVADQMKAEGGIEEILFGANKGYVREVRIINQNDVATIQFVVEQVRDARTA